MDAKKLGKEAKKVKKERDYVLDSDDVAVITVKAKGTEQIFSEYDYDRSEKLQPELADYIYEKASRIPRKTDLRLKIYTFEDVDKKEVISAVHGNFERELKSENYEDKSNWKLIAAMILLGVLSLTLMFLSYSFFPNEYLEAILEIISWVFIWEAVDAFVLRRAEMRKRRFILLKLCTCEISVVKLKKGVTEKKKKEQTE